MTFETHGNKIILNCMNNPQKKPLKIHKYVSLVYTTGMPQGAVLGTDASPTAVSGYLRSLILISNSFWYTYALLNSLYIW